MSSGSFDILLVDDEAALLLTVGDLLRTRGFSVLVALDASRALAQLENKVGLIILDINLAGEDGLRLMDFLKANHPDIPIIIYTGAIHDELEVRNILERGAKWYVKKGGPIQDLFDAIQKIRDQRG